MDSCVIEITSAAHDHGNLNIRPCGEKFFPRGIFGGSSREAGVGVQVIVHAEGLSKPIKTDIPTDKKTGRPRWIFRERKWVKEFVRRHNLQSGDVITIQRLAIKAYKVKPNNRRKECLKKDPPNSLVDGTLDKPRAIGHSKDKLGEEQYLFGSEAADSERSELKPDARKLNILKSPKKGGSSTVDSIPYLKELGIEITENTQPIQFTPNTNEPIHRWASYVQGFSALFVRSILNQYKQTYGNPVILDPFAGCGTVPVEAKLSGHESVGTELNPLLKFIASTKLDCWDVSPKDLLGTLKKMPRDKLRRAPAFLKSTSQFKEHVLHNLEVLNGGIASVRINTENENKIRDLLKLAFSAILVDCSNLKRSPCLGYVKDKPVKESTPFVLLTKKVHEIADDLSLVQSAYEGFTKTKSDIICSNAMTFKHRRKFDLVITSPPYMNGLDYVMNYKIEMGWLEFVHSQKDLKKIKDDMVVCDNVSKGLIRNFYESPCTYTNDWIEQIKASIKKSIVRRGAYRRQDMPYIVHKYFDDLHRVIKNVASSLKSGGRFILVVGDSLIADVYVPTDLLIAKIGLDSGLTIEKIEKARERRSGQIRSYQLRESIVTLAKR